MACRLKGQTLSRSGSDLWGSLSHQRNLGRWVNLSRAMVGVNHTLNCMKPFAMPLLYPSNASTRRLYICGCLGGFNWLGGCGSVVEGAAGLGIP